MTVTETVITRADYMDGRNTHDEYYRQLSAAMGVAYDPQGAMVQKLAENLRHVSTLEFGYGWGPLAKWDARAISTIVSREALEERGETWSLCTGVCMHKAAAAVAVEKARPWGTTRSDRFSACLPIEGEPPITWHELFSDTDPWERAKDKIPAASWKAGDGSARFEVGRYCNAHRAGNAWPYASAIGVNPTRRLLHWIRQNMLAIEYDRLHFEVIERDPGPDGPRVAVFVKHSQIIGSRNLATVDVPRGLKS